MSEKIALLIDAENTSVKYLDVVLKELKQYGDISFQRMYGDFSNPKMSDWAKRGLDYAIVPIHQAIYKTGKMDILYQNNVDGFCIVTSDSDFTRLANRLREGGKRVIGMGKSDASKTFISACNEYKFLDKITDDDTDAFDDSDKNDSAVTPLSDIKMAINYIVQQAESRGEVAYLGSTKSQLQREFADFDERNYGYTLFRKFVEDETKFEVKKKGSSAYIVRKHAEEKQDSVEKIEKYIIDKAKNGADLGDLGREIHIAFPNFKYKELGYSKLSKYIESLSQVKIITDDGNKNYVVLK